MLEDEALYCPDDDDADAAEDSIEDREEQISENVTRLDLESKESMGMSKLRHAVETGDLELLQTLIRSGMDVNSKDEHGQTALHYAAEIGSIELIKFLVNHGADLSTTDDSGFSPVLWATISGQEHTAQQLLFEGIYGPLDDEKLEFVLTWAIRLGRATIVGRMITEYSSILSYADLHEAAACGHLHIVMMLLEHGLRPDELGLSGFSAIFYAAEEGHHDIVKLLLDHGAEPDATGIYDATPLHCAAIGGHVSIIDMLLKTPPVNPDSLARARRGWSVLSHAVTGPGWDPLHHQLTWVTLTSSISS